MSDDLVKQALAELGDVVRCRCHEAYKGRGLHDPDCQCDSAEALATVTKHIEALTEQLEAARADAKEAEAYAEELEAQLNICRMAQVVMENGIAEAEKERDDYAFKLADANNTYSEMHVALSEANDKLATCEKYRDAYAECDMIGTQAVRDLEAKLAKAVEALRFYADENRYGLPSDGPWGLGSTDFGKIARALLAEIEGEKT